MPFCKNCGTEYEEGAKFCPSCGKPIAEQTTPPTPPQQQAQTSGGPKQPSKKLGCLFWGLAIFLSPFALIWALTLDKNHPQKKSAIIVPSIFLLGFILMMIMSGADSDSYTNVHDSAPQKTEVVEVEKTETSSVTAKEQEYFSAVGKQSQTVGSAINQIGVLSQNPLFGNDDWTLKMGAQLAIIQSEYTTAKAMTLPNSLKSIHSKYLEGLSHYNSMTSLLAKGIDNSNSDLISKAADEMAKGSACVIEAVALIDEFNQKNK